MSGKTLHCESVETGIQKRRTSACASSFPDFKISFVIHDTVSWSCSLPNLLAPCRWTPSSRTKSPMVTSGPEQFALHFISILTSTQSPNVSPIQSPMVSPIKHSHNLLYNTFVNFWYVTVKKQKLNTIDPCFRPTTDISPHNDRPRSGKVTDKLKNQAFPLVISYKPTLDLVLTADFIWI